MRTKNDFIIGIDEVGRGALAGPVVVVATRVARGFGMRPHPVLGRPKDSKQLSARQREAWFAYVEHEPKILYAAAFVYPRQIEKRNISGAANMAALRACKKLISSFPKEESGGGKSTPIVLDGGLFLGSRKSQPAHAKTMIKADETVPAVAIASIIAKVIRDRAMVRLGKQYPQYGFDVHKGYGTERHKKALGNHGPCIVHRKTFLRNT